MFTCDRCRRSLKKNCKASGSLNIIRTTCEGKQSCSIKASNSVFGDLCKGVAKYVFLNYSCITAGELFERSTSYPGSVMN